jgi:endonuclease-8
MPEGPEIRRAADKIAQALIGRPVQEVFFAFEALKTYESVLKGQTITAIDTYGKAMVTRFANGLNIYSHNQLYGVWYVRPAFDFPDTKRLLRVALHNETYSALLYSASEIAVLQDSELSYHPFLSRLGPDLLHEDVTIEQTIARFQEQNFKRKKLYTLLLDQQFLAGVGNYLRSEILFVAGVHPQKKPLDCSIQELEKLGEAAVNLTRQSYSSSGITNNLELAKTLKEKGVPRAKYRHWVFNRDGSPCFNCGQPIIKDVLGGRRLYYCPTCQPALLST